MKNTSKEKREVEYEDPATGQMKKGEVDVYLPLVILPYDWYFDNKVFFNLECDETGIIVPMPDFYNVGWSIPLFPPATEESHTIWVAADVKNFKMPPLTLSVNFVFPHTNQSNPLELLGPAIKQVYGGVKQLIETIFLANPTQQFRRVVLIEYPRKGIYAIAFTTGAGQGIGRGIALKLAEAGYDIVANDIVADPANTAKGLYEVKARVEALGRACLPVRGDISNLADHDLLIAAAVERFGRIDVLVNNAGVAPKVRADILETSPESYDRLMTINLRGPFFLTQKVARQMIRQGPAARPPVIVFITSISAYVSSTARPEYCISKAGLSMAAMLYADRLAREGICVYEIRPGIIATDMTSVVKEKYDKLIAEGLLPQARWGTPQDVGKAVVALAGGALAYSTGQVIEVGGGFGLRRL